MAHAGMGAPGQGEAAAVAEVVVAVAADLPSDTEIDPAYKKPAPHVASGSPS